MSLHFSSPWNLLELHSSKSKFQNTHIHTWDLVESDFEPIARETIAMCEKVYKDIECFESNFSFNLIEVYCGF